MGDGCGQTALFQCPWNSLDAVSGWALAHHEFGSSVNQRGSYAHHIAACPPGFENLTASLELIRKRPTKTLNFTLSNVFLSYVLNST